MKRVFSMVVVLTMAIMGYSQSRLIATLSHNGEISAFYGASAFQEAYEASQHGDIITLSSGTFAPVDIKKALTIRGAGMYVDSVTHILPTVITSNFTIEIPDSIEQHLTMEGIYYNNNTIYVKGTLKEASFQKCRLNNFFYSDVSSTKIDKLTFVHCKITKGISLPKTAFASFINSYVANPRTNSSASSNMDFLNCVVEVEHVSSSLYYSSLTNCIIRHTRADNPSLPSSSTALHCLGIGNTTMFSYATNIESTMFAGELSELFKTYTGTYDDNETFELTDVAKIKYLGNDLKQIGMYGGNMPFNPNATNPRIVKCDVASESTADGKLSVDIEVSSAE